MFAFKSGIPGKNYIILDPAIKSPPIREPQLQ